MRPSLVRLLSVLLSTLVVVAAHAGDAPVVSEAWSRATPPGVEVGAAYMVIEGGNKDDRLVGASSTRAAMVHLHDVVEEEGVAKMRSTEEVEIPAGKRVELAPKGKHLMLMGLDAPLVAGQTYPLVLQFAESGEQTVAVTVREATAESSHNH
jgi:periplasmic copper chaperone A